MMNEITLLVASLLIGIVAGCIYFAGLWRTTRQMMTSARPLVVYSLSLIIRMGVLLVGMWSLIRVGAAYFALAVVGFLIARVAFASVAGFSIRPRNQVPREA